MKLYKVPMLNDYPEHRGNFIQSTMTNDMAFLNPNGKMILIHKEVQAAIHCLFSGTKELPDRTDDSLNRFIIYAERVKRIFVTDVA
jgi:hypothetical protein